MVTKVLTNYARVLMFLEDLVSLPEDCGQNSSVKQNPWGLRHPCFFPSGWRLFLCQKNMLSMLI